MWQRTRTGRSLAALLLLAGWPVPVATASPSTDTAVGAVPGRHLFPLAIAVAAEASSSDTCPANYYSCASQGAQFDGICCPYDQVCSIASDNRPACCPAGNVCTGSAPSTYVTTTAAASYVPNAYFSFPYLLPSGVAATTALADANACDAVLSQCRKTFSLCTSQLQSGSSGTDNVDGGGGGVTIVVSGSTTLARRVEATARPEGKKRDATTALAAASAASVCSSLGRQACGGLPTNAAGCSSAFAEATGFSADSGSSRQHDVLSWQWIGVASVTAVLALMMI